MWFYLYLNDLKSFFEVEDIIKDNFMDIGNPPENGESEPVHVFPQLDGVTGGVHYYFSPGAQKIAVQVGATECDVAPFEILHGQILLSSRYFKLTQDNHD